MKVIIEIKTLSYSPDPQDAPLSKRHLLIEQGEFPEEGLRELTEVIYRVINHHTGPGS